MQKRATDAEQSLRDSENERAHALETLRDDARELLSENEQLTAALEASNVRRSEHEAVVKELLVVVTTQKTRLRELAAANAAAVAAAARADEPARAFATEMERLRAQAARAEGLAAALGAERDRVAVLEGTVTAAEASAAAAHTAAAAEVITDHYFCFSRNIY